jgi:hypothetical protein
LNGQASIRFVLMLSLAVFTARGREAGCALYFTAMDPAGETEEPAAIHADDARFLSWAVSCEVERGPGLITYPDSITVTAGEAVFATGPGGNGTVSLGDGGRATLHFEYPICDGPGTDFAVFENSFDGAFLELGFVEVSSDGERFVRFPASSLTPLDVQVGPFGTLDPGLINNLAGKDPAGWGTPFDLEELKDSVGLDIGIVQAVRIIDVIGILDENLGSRDAGGRLINDPFPTPFETGGFDLDAVGVLHHSPAGSSARGEAGSPGEAGSLRVYPVPCRTEMLVEDPQGLYRQWALLDLQGRVVRQGSMNRGAIRIGMEDLPGGTYLLRCESARGLSIRRIMHLK